MPSPKIHKSQRGSGHWSYFAKAVFEKLFLNCSDHCRKIPRTPRCDCIWPSLTIDWVQRTRRSLNIDELQNSSRTAISRYNNLGVLYDKQGRYDEAIAAFDSASRIDPNNGGAKNNLATARKNKAAIQERQAQIQRAENAAAINPKDPQASFQAARLHAHYGNRDAALQWLDRARRQGYKDLASVRNDPSFKSFSNDRDFELILVGK